MNNANGAGSRIVSQNSGRAYRRQQRLSAAMASPVEQLERRMLLSGSFAVAATSPAAGATVTMPVTSFDVTYNQDVLPASVSPANLSLNYGIVTGAALTSSNTVHYTIAGINTETSVTASIAAGAVTDQAGDPSQAFSTSFTTDIGTIPFNAPFIPAGPAGSLASAGTTTGTIGTASDTDSFTVELAAGEVLSASVRASPSLQPGLQLVDPQGNIIATGLGPAGSPALIQGQQIGVSGQYTITVAGAAGTTGGYTLTASINAISQPSAFGGPANNSIASAQNLDGAFVSLGGSAGQATVLGTATQQSMTAGDLYSFTLLPGDSVSLGVQGTDSATVSVELLDAGNALLAQGSAITGYGSKLNSAITDFVSPQGGTYYAVVTAPSATGYGLIVTRDAEFDTTASPKVSNIYQPIESSAPGGIARAVGQLASSNSFQDAYGIFLHAGATLHAWTGTPQEGIGGSTDALDPTLSISAPGSNPVFASDDNSAPDGRNASLSYTAKTDGVYYVAVSSATVAGSRTSGDYILNIQGADAVPLSFTTNGYVPSNFVSSSAPQTLTFTFTQGIRLDSVQASDFSVDGVPATALTPANGTSLTFTLPVGIGQGVHTYTIPAGAFTSIQGAPVTAVTGQFTVDSIPPRIVSSSIQEGDVVPAGTLAYTAQFSKAMPSYIASARYVSMTGGTSGAPVAPASISLDSSGTVLTVVYAGLADDAYTLTLVSAGSSGGGIADAAGNALDGEPHFPMPPNQSGDGKAGGNFVVHFTADVGTEPLPGLQPALPLGSGLYTATTNGLIASTSDTDSYTVNLNSGQTLAAVVSPAAGSLLPKLVITDPSGTILTSTSATASGQSESASIPPVAVAGVYTITVAGASGTGRYSLAVTVDGTFQATGGANHTPASAQDLTGGLMTQPGGLAQTGVIGSLDTGPVLPQETEPNDQIGNANSAIYNFQPAGGSQYQLSLSGTISGTSPIAWYKLGQFQPGEIVSIAGNCSPSLANFNFTLAHGTGYYSEVAWGQAASNAITKFTVNYTDTFFLEVVPTYYGYQGGYTVGLYLENASTPPGTGTGTGTPPGPGGSSQGPADVSSSWKPVTYVSQTTGSATGSDTDFFTYHLPAGEWVTVDIGTTNWQPQVALLDASGNVLLQQERQQQFYPLPHDAYIHAFAIPATGTYYLRVSAPSGSTGGAYTAAVYVSGTNPLNGIPAPHADYYSVSLISGQTLSAALKAPTGGAAELALTDAAGNVLATGLTGASNADSLLEDFLAPNDGTYYLRVSGDAGTAYDLALIRGGEFQAAPNNSILAAQDLGTDGLVAANLSGAGDYYRVWAPAPATLQISTATPGGPGPMANALDPKLTLYGPGNLPLASDDNSAADGRNALISYAVQSAGWYTVEVSGKGTGAYILSAKATSPAGAPSAPRLQAAYDTGISSSDGITRLDNSSPQNALAFQIENVIAGDTVTIYADGTPIGSATATSSSLIVTTDGATTLPDGPHIITARQAAPGDQPSLASLGSQITIDTSNASSRPPVIQLDARSDSGVSDNDGITNITTPMLELSGATYYRVYRDGVPVSAILTSGQYTSPTLAEGTYLFTATAVDVAGNETAPSQSISVTIDTTSPAPPTTPPVLESTSDSGISNTDGITNVAQPVLDLSAGPYWQVYRDGTLVSGPYGTGAAFQSQLLPDGTYSFAIRAVDVAGNVSAPSAPLSITIDTTPPAPPQTGALDPTFGSGGIVQATGNSSSSACAVAVQMDGKIVTAGQIWDATAKANVFEVERFNSDGTPDVTFGTQGAVVLAGIHGTARAVAIEPDGKIVVGGSGSGFAIVRLNPSGAPDSTFGANSVVLWTSVDQLTGMVVQPDGKILVAASSLYQPPYWPGYRLLRFNPDGTADNSFGSNGSVAVWTSTPYSATGLALEPDGRIIVTGSPLDRPAAAELVITEYNPDGSEVLGFGNGGQLTPAFTIGQSAIAVQADGKFVIAGEGAQGTPHLLQIQRYLEDGNLDAGFNGGNVVATPIGSGNSGAISVAILPDGRVVAAGYAIDPSEDRHFALACYLPDGALDPHFGNQGIVTTALSPSDQLFAVTPGPGGTLLAAGQIIQSYPTSHLVLARYLAGPGLELVGNSDTGASAFDNITGDTNPTFQLPVSGPYYRVYRNGALVSPLIAASQTWDAGPQPAGTWDFTYTVVDAAGNESGPSSPARITFDVDPPSASLAAPTLKTAGTSPLTFTVTYADNGPVDPRSIANAPLTVTGPDGRSWPVILLSAGGTPGYQVTATYSIAAPPGGWVYADNGTYSVSLPSAIVADLAGNTMPGGNLGSFAINLPPVSISGTAFNDVNNDGAPNAGEGPLAGVTVFLDLNDNGVLDSGEPSQVTNAQGQFAFGGLNSGAYVVRQIPPAGYAVTACRSFTVATASGAYEFGARLGDVLISSVTMNLSYFMLVSRNFGQSGTFASGDANGDGTVNMADLLLVTRNFGHALPQQSATAAAVPSQPVRTGAKRRP